MTRLAVLVALSELLRFEESRKFTSVNGIHSFCDRSVDECEIKFGPDGFKRLADGIGNADARVARHLQSGRGWPGASNKTSEVIQLNCAA